MSPGWVRPSEYSSTAEMLTYMSTLLLQRKQKQVLTFSQIMVWSCLKTMFIAA